jgi:hypothetical protein
MGPIDRNVQPPLEGHRTSSVIPSSSSVEAAKEVDDQDGFWLSRARDAYTGGRDWFDTSIRKVVEGNLAHFRNQHAPGSKYHSDVFKKKSHSFVPRTRAMVRRTEAAAAIAFFATQELINVEPVNQSKADQRDGAAVQNALVNYRLDNDVPWFQLVIGAAQDASTTGVVISKQTWDYKTRPKHMMDIYEDVDTGELSHEMSQELEVVRDQPDVKLIPIENLVIDPACDWLDPINSSPYLIELEPMYVYQIEEKMQEINPRTGRPLYRQMDRALLSAAIQQDWDSIRRMREGQRVDKYEANNYVNAYNKVWVHHNIVRIGQRDWCYDTLGVELVLSDPEPIEDVYPHLRGLRRPYAMGTLALETHKLYPMAPVEMSAETQRDLNDLRNLRMDNVKLGLNKRYFIRRGSGVDITTLLRNIPGSGVQMNNPEGDVKETQPQDVTASAYQEQDRMNLEFDEISGSFSAASVGSNRKLNETVGGMTLLSSDASQVKEYEIRTLAETWVEEVLAQLVLLEAAYETDEEVLDSVAADANLPVERVMEVLGARVRTKCNVGFNSTSPERRMAKIMLALDALSKAKPDMLQGLDAHELAKEIFGAIGYRDGQRFFPALAGQEDPQVAQLKQQIQQLQQVIDTKQIEQQGKVEVARMTGEYRLAATQLQVGVAAEIGRMTAQIEAYKLKMGEVELQLAMEKSDVERRQLYLEREALSHAIQESNREFQLKLTQIAQGGDGTGGGAKSSKPQPKPKALAAPQPGGAYNLPGNDKAGVVSRDRYGAIPQQEG